MFGGNGYNPYKAEEPKQQIDYLDLVNYIDKKVLECLNFSKTHTIEHALFEPNDSYYLESDVDPQIVINIGFTCPIKLHHFTIRGFNDGTRPKLLKLFVNKKPMNFNECESDDPTQEFLLKEEDFKGETLTKFVKFQSVKTLTVIICYFKNKINLFRFILKIIKELIQLK